MFDSDEIRLAKLHVKITARHLKIVEDLFDSNPNEHYLLALEKAELQYEKNVSILEEKIIDKENIGKKFIN